MASHPEGRNTRVDELVLAAVPLPEPLHDAADRQREIVADPRRFLSLLRTRRPALVVIWAPPAGPEELVAVARERRLRPDMRAVLIDARDAIGERLEALRAGFDEALDSNLSREELSGRLRLLADQARASRPGDLITISDELVLDTDLHELLMRGQSIHLRPREYAMLEVLARHPGRTFSRRQLLEAVGAKTTIRDGRTIDVHVRWLREKLARTGNAPARLVTVRGVGYRLEPAPVSVNGTLTERERAVHGPGQS